MAYIGKEPIVGNFQKCDAITVVNGQAAYTLQVSSTNVTPESANHMLVSLNGILQAPTTSFTVSGSTLTFASNLATGDVIDFVMLLGNVLDLGVPSDGTVTSAKITYPLTTFSSTGIDDNATSTAITIDSSEVVRLPVGVLRLQNSTTGTADTDGLLIEASGNDVYINNKENADMYFRTNNTDRMRITSAGHVIAPNLNTTGSTNNRYPLYWAHTGTTGSIEPYTGSIRAMKTDINNMSSVNWIHSLTPRSFKFRDYETDEDGNRTYLETTNNLPNTEYGLIAEEVNQVNGSDYILDKQTDEDGNENVKGVLYHNLVPVLLKAVQEQKTKIEELEARITTLENA